MRRQLRIIVSDTSYAALTLLMMLFGHDPKELTRAFAIYGAAAPAGGTAGVFLSIGNLDSYVRNLSAGLGFISLAALIFGQWKPLGVLAATILFGFLQALSITLGGTDLLPPTLVQALPYLITIIALAFTGRSAGPKALGKPLDG